MKALPLVVVLLASPLLAGCLGLGDEPTPPTNATDDNTSDLPIEMPDGRGGSFNAFNETNLTDSIGHHNHDYWGGRSRVTIIEGHAEMSPFPDQSGVSAEFRPPSGPQHLVYEGTATVEVLITNPQRHACYPLLVWNGDYICTDHTQTGTEATGELKGPALPDAAPSSGLRLEYLHAASNLDEWIDAGAIAFGTPAVISLKDPRWTDMPHSTGSLWVFRIVSPNSQDATLTFDIAITAVRKEGEIPKWPGHPVFYTDTKHYRVVYDGIGSVEETTDGGVDNTAEPGKLISAGTRTLIVYANITSVTPGVPNNPPTHYWLYFHNASYTTWNSTSPFDANYTADKGSYQWILPVDPNGMDSPYASASRWEFLVRGAYTTPLVSCIAGCFPYKVEYKLTIVATDLYPKCLKEEAGKCAEYAYSETRDA